jgi:hypothetical protein
MSHFFCTYGTALFRIVKPIPSILIDDESSREMMELQYALIKKKRIIGREGFGGEVMNIYCMVYGEKIFARFL